MEAPYEKLGAFFLGRPYDISQGKPSEGLILYDSKDLVTHAVCVGMTGSGKTGLCTCLLEEAAIDGIPSVIIDPKGDMTNLMLNFPGLTAQEFRPWINEDEARVKGVSPDDYAQQQADLWKKGLAGWGMDGTRIQRLRDSAEFAVYTPASNAGIPVSILKSFAAPPSAIIDDNELLAERINTTATGLLTLLGIAADPVKSREHILISNILSANWKIGKDLDLASLIQQIQTPPIKRVGVLDLDSFYPANQRFELAMRLNNLLAAPGFELWLEGAPLDIGSFYYTRSGRPRVSIFYIAHLGDAERMFFVSLFLNQVLSWVRSQSGTTSLRSILYMDEIFGYFPPVANPPSKPPLLTLLKQARAFGQGIVLATQNPVDLDYKGLANTGTWLLGRLQTERDKARVLDGLEGVTAVAGGKFDRQTMDRTLSGLGKRVFVLHNVNKPAPETFETRWALSYLRGPLTRDQIRVLMAPVKAALAPTATAAQAPAVGRATPQATAPAAFPAAAPVGPGQALGGTRPILPAGIEQFFLAPKGKRESLRAAVTYLPALYAGATVYFTNEKLQVDASNDLAFLVPIQEGPVAVDWDTAQETGVTAGDLRDQPLPNATFADLPAAAARLQSYATWRTEFARWLARTQKLELMRSTRLGLVSQPGESERDFRLRLMQAARESRDEVKEKLRKKYETKMSALQERIRKAEQAVEREKAQADSQKMQTAMSVGATLLGAFIGRKPVSAGTLGRATTAARSASRAKKESEDIRRAEENVKALQEQLKQLEAEFEAEVNAYEGKGDPLSEKLEKVLLKPKATGVTVKTVALVWEAS